MANPDLKWETTVTRNAGLDITTFNSRLSGTIEVYLNTTRDLLIRFRYQEQAMITSTGIWEIRKIKY